MIYLLVDFGSTYTKIVAVDLLDLEVKAVVRENSTVDSDIRIGFEAALKKLKSILGQESIETNFMFACSSAKGGLRMVAIGLVPELTVKAATHAALGAGAKLVGTFAYKLTRREIAEIEKATPDMILLVGGTDGGNEEVILYNSRLLSESKLTCPVVVAGNKVVAETVQEILEKYGKHSHVTDNVMPELNKLNVDPTREVIRKIFMEEIIKAKGIDKVSRMIDKVIMPTPMAVLKAATLLSQGIESEAGLGELIVVDVGGATTDVVSIGSSSSSRFNAILKGLPDPYAKRSVEGDLGIRYSANTILRQAGMKMILQNMGNVPSEQNPNEVEARINFLPQHIGTIFQTEEEIQLDIGLARTAVAFAMERHAGSVEPVQTPMGTIYIQRGKDLTGVTKVIGTGGIFSYGKNERWILSAVKYDQNKPFCLKPYNPDFFIDELYILYAIGLLTDIAPREALVIAKKHLKKV